MKKKIRNLKEIVKLPKNRINVGEKAPLFKLESYNAGMIDLSEMIGKQKIVLIFSRYFGCPMCQLDLKLLLESERQIKEKGAIILYITQSGKEVAQNIIKEKKLDFPVIPSTKEKLYQEYDLGMMTLGMITSLPTRMKTAKSFGITHGEYEGWEKQASGQFVIDKDGILIHAKKSWLDIDSILKVL